MGITVGIYETQLSTYLRYKESMGLLEYHFWEADPLNFDGLRFHVTVLWKTLHTLILPEFRRLCDDLGFAVKLIYRQIGMTVDETRRLERDGPLRPDALMRVQLCVG
jgi:hypothetical protein